MNSYISIKDYLKNGKTDNGNIFVGKINHSYIIGPLINDEFDEVSFYKRLMSSSIYDASLYKNVSKYKAFKLINRFYGDLGSNQVLELFRSGKIVKYDIISLPGGLYEKK